MRVKMQLAPHVGTLDGMRAALHALDSRVKFVGALEVPWEGPPRSAFRKWAQRQRWWFGLRARVAEWFGLEIPPPSPHVSLLVIFKGPFDEGLVREAQATIEDARPAGVPVDVKAWWT